MSNRDSDKKKKQNQGNPGSSRPGTKFMERPASGESKEPSSSSDPWSAIDEEVDTKDVGEHAEIPTQGKQDKQGKPGKQQQPPKPGWEKEADEEGTLGEDDKDKE